MIDIVSATRLREDEFWHKSALGLSLRRLAYDDRLRPWIAFANSRGLPEVYNDRLLSPDAAEFLVFIHDDVWIDDNFFGGRVIDALGRFDVVGVAGNRRRVRGQPAWHFVDTRGTWDDLANLSGCVAHGPQPFGAVSFFGPAPMECELLDGVFLAARKSTLVDRGVRFDPRFAFHFYDMDFCRSARQCGLRLGTWPVSLTHRSAGSFGRAEWAEAYRRYLEKWSDEDAAVEVK